MKCVCGYEDESGFTFAVLQNGEANTMLDIIAAGYPYTMKLYVCPECGTVRAEK